MIRHLGTLLMVLLLAASCSGDKQSQQETGEVTPQETKGADTMAMAITSDAFAEGDTIPKQYTCDGADISPPLKWTGIPEGAKSLALISDDPDAPSGMWVHWVLFNIPPEIDGLPSNMPKSDTLDIGAVHGVTDFGRPGYGGPCPPSGTHRYYFKHYALDTLLNLSGQVDKKQLEEAMEGHVLESAQLMGKYSRE